VLLVNIFTHSMWADELKPWAICRASSSLMELYLELYAEGHPPLWYAILWALSQLTTDVAAMKCVNASVGVAALCLLWLRSPFSSFEKVLLSTSFQLGYGLSVLSRSYCLGIFLVYLFVSGLPTFKKKPWFGWLVLAFLANVHIYFAMVSFCLGALWIYKEGGGVSRLRGLSFYLLALYICSATVMQILRFTLGPNCWYVYLIPSFLAGLLLTSFALSIGVPIRKRTIWVVSGIGFAILTMFARALTPWAQAIRWPRVLESLSVLGRGLVPVVNPLQGDYWNLGMPNAIGIILLLMALVGIVGYFRTEPLALGLLIGQTAFLASFFTLFYRGHLWHSGVLFTGLIATVWMCRTYNPKLGFHGLLLILLLPQSLTGINAILRSKITPLSNTPHVAHWLEQEGLTDELLIGQSLFPTLGVPVCLGIPIYFPAAQDKVIYYRWQAGSPPRLLAKLIKRQMNLENRTVAYLVFPIGNQKKVLRALHFYGPEFKLEEVYRNANALRENYLVYKLQLASPPSSD
jgi:hypothetical protein